MKWLERMHHPEKYWVVLLKWGLLGVVTGGIGGVLGAVFHHVLHFVTGGRTANPWIMLGLPLAGLLSLGLYQVMGLKGNRGTNAIIDAVLKGEKLKPQIAPTIFTATALTHLFGGSAGREGAALQLGGSVASALAGLLKLPENQKKVMVMAGMSAVFAGLFGTPLTATFFCMEFASVGTIFTPALMPCYLAAFTASTVSAALGVHAETFFLETVIPFAIPTAAQVAVLAVLVGVLGIAMCAFFHWAEHFAAKKITNPWIRIVLGGCAILALTFLVGDARYSGAGMDMALKACGGDADWFDFLLKMLFTAVTL